MATSADFYTLIKGELNFIGSTLNAYDGDYLESKKLNHFIEKVKEELKENNSIEGKWYWPWENSKLTDEVFIFELTPSLLNKQKGKVLMKISSDYDFENGIANFIEYNGCLGDVDTDGLYIESIQLPQLG